MDPPETFRRLFVFLVRDEVKYAPKMTGGRIKN
jgi:hypothetical protein